MVEEMLVVSTTKRRRYSAYRGEISPAAENLVKRNFRADSPNQKWLTDITEFQLPGGKVYLSPMVDCFDGLVVSWAISTRPDAALVNTMLDVAITALHDDERPIVHSDRGPLSLARMAIAHRGCGIDSVDVPQRLHAG